MPITIVDMHYLAVCAIYRNEARYLREWLEFHRLVGVEKFFLYDNDSTDDHREQLAPYLADGTVEVEPWPASPGQIAAYEHCLEERREDARWIAFIDLDEFLFSPQLMSLPDVLVDYERHPGVAVNWSVFGSSGHKTPPEGLVIENYVWRAPDAGKGNRHVKSVVDPRRTVGSRWGNPHCFTYSDGEAVDENGRPVHHPFGMTNEVSFSRLRVNHYYIKSEAQWEAKRAAPKASGGSRQLPPERPARFSVRDELITAYVPAVRDALSRQPPPLEPS
jgi:Glycosyltransferase family 92